VRITTIQARAAVLLLVYSTIILLSLADNSELVHSLLTTARITKVALVVAGLVTMARDQVSYYHVVALADMCQLLTFPEFLVYFNRIQSVGTFRFLERFLNTIGSIMVIVLDTVLAMGALQMDKLSSWCIPGESTDPSTFPVRDSPYLNWGSGTAYFFILCYYLLINSYIVALWFRGRTAIYQFPAHAPAYYWTVAQCAFMTILVTLSLTTTVRWVNQGGVIGST